MVGNTGEERTTAPVIVRIQKEPGNEDLPLPEYHSEQAAGMDLAAACDESLMLTPGSWALVPTGLRIGLPPGYEAQVRPRSGLALRYGVTVLNSPGTIDADYRGPLRVILVNFGTEPFEISRGMRIAQLVVAPVVRATIKPVEVLDETERGEGGFGHTGLNKV